MLELWHMALKLKNDDPTPDWKRLQAQLAIMFKLKNYATAQKDGKLGWAAPFRLNPPLDGKEWVVDEKEWVVDLQPRHEKEEHRANVH